MPVGRDGGEHCRRKKFWRLRRTSLLPWRKKPSNQGKTDDINYVLLCSNVASERKNIHVLFTLLFAMGSGISILIAPIAAAISPFMSPLNPPSP